MSADRHHIDTVILFADVVGSTPLYESLGDDKARAIVGHLMQVLGEVVVAHGGTVIKTIGDAVMAQIPQPDFAIDAAVTMHKRCAEIPVPGGKSLSIKIGMHYGNVIAESGDLYGDSVNLAARIVDLSKSKKIYFTQDLLEQLSPAQAHHARLIDFVTVKGKTIPQKLFEFVAEQEGLTQMAAIIQTSQMQVLGDTLILRYNGKSTEMTLEVHSVVIGRGEQSDIVINSPIASRTHCKIERRKRGFYLVDNSTNGTSLRTENGDLVRVHREDRALVGKGKICMNVVFSEQPELIVEYSIKTPF